MTPILRMLLSAVLISAAIPASAIYKCESGAKVTYSDTACIGSQSTDLGNPATRSDNSSQIRRELAQQKAEVKQLETSRHKQEAQQEKLRKTALRTEGHDRRNARPWHAAKSGRTKMLPPLPESPGKRRAARRGVRKRFTIANAARRTADCCIPVQ